jgi:hypothetical protein
MGGVKAEPRLPILPVMGGLGDDGSPSGCRSGRLVRLDVVVSISQLGLQACLLSRVLICTLVPLLVTTDSRYGGSQCEVVERQRQLGQTQSRQRPSTLAAIPFRLPKVLTGW